MCTNGDAMTTNDVIAIRSRRSDDDAPKIPPNTPNSCDNLLHVLAGWTTITPAPLGDDGEKEDEKDDDDDDDDAISRCTTTNRRLDRDFGRHAEPTDAGALTTPTAPPPPTEPFPAKGRALLNTLLPNLKTSPSESPSPSSSSLARIEALLQTLVKRVESVESKLDEALSRCDERQTRDDNASDDACGDDGDQHFHTPKSEPRHTPKSEPRSVSIASSPCLVRASPSPSIVNAFAELYVS